MIKISSEMSKSTENSSSNNKDSKNGLRISVSLFVWKICRFFFFLPNVFNFFHFFTSTLNLVENSLIWRRSFIGPAKQGLEVVCKNAFCHLLWANFDHS